MKLYPCSGARFAVLSFFVLSFSLLFFPCGSALAARAYGPGGVGSVGGMSGGPGGVGGVGGMGYGRPAPPPPPPSAPPSHYGSRRDADRGYVGNVPHDPWHRDGDFKARDYQFRHGPPPRHAEPPKVLAPHRPDSTRTPSLVIPRLPDEGSLPRDASDVTGRKAYEKRHGARERGAKAHGSIHILEGEGFGGR